ncbi:MAG: hypothetical protein ACI83B_002507 [Sediminicola sp.]
MKITYQEKVQASDLPVNAVADTYLFSIQIIDVNRRAHDLLNEISNTSWIQKLSPVAQASYTIVTHKTIAKLVHIFTSVNNKVTKDFGEFMISMSSGECLNQVYNHTVLPLSELWKEKTSNNHGFDFHTLSPNDKFSFGEAKYTSSGNSYTTSAEQVVRFLKEGKDGVDAVHLINFGSSTAIDNLIKRKRGCIVAFSINSDNYKQILKNTLNNENVQELSKCCDELYIIGVKA